MEYFIIHSLLISILLGLLVLWFLYSIAVTVYLTMLSRQYLCSLPKDDKIKNKPLKSYDSLIYQYANYDSLNVLVLTGGGVRGLVPLHILSYIESITGYKSGEIFDFMAGASTGAISVSALSCKDDNGKFIFTAKGLFQEYEDNVKEIFSSPWYHQLLTLFGILAPRFLPDGKLSVLRRYLGQLTFAELEGNLLIPVYDIVSNKLMILRNWDALDSSYSNFLVSDIVNGSSNPPTLFIPNSFSLNNTPYIFIDPAGMLNNPALHVILSLRTMFPHKQINLLLIDNGDFVRNNYSYNNVFSFGMYGLYQYIINLPTIAEQYSVDFIKEYLSCINGSDHGINFMEISSEAHRNMKPSNTSDKNIRVIREYADRLLYDNISTIDDYIEILMHKRVHN